MNLVLKRGVRLMAMVLLLAGLGTIAYVKAGRGRMEQEFPSRKERPQTSADVPSPPKTAAAPSSSGGEIPPQRKASSIPLGSVAVLEAGRFWEDEATFGCQFGTFDAAFNGDRLEMRLREGGPGSEAQLSLRLDTISIGERVIAQGDGQVKPTCSKDRRSISYVRRGVEEKYIASESALEQLFVIMAAPESREAITVTETVETSFEPPVDGTAADKILFRRRGKEVFTISDAVVVDAAGRKLKLPLSYRSGKLSLTVPEEWVKEATFPITIDPLVGTPVAVVASNPDLPSWGKVSAAYNSSNNEWLVTYQLWAGSNPGYNVYARRISSAGALLGSQITVASNSKNDQAATVAYAPSPINRYLIAWTQLTTTFPVLSGRILNGDGTFFASQFQIANPPFGTSESNVAFDGANWCVMYDSNDGINYYMKVRFVSPTGTLGTLVALESTGFASSGPRLVFSGGTYAAVWAKRINGSGFAEYNTQGRTFLPDGSLLTGIVTLNDDVQNSSVWISGGGGKFFLTKDVGSEQAGSICNSVLSVENGPFAVQGASSEFSGTSSEWLQIFAAPDPGNPGNTELWGNHVSLSGAVYSPARITYNLASEQLAAMSWNSTTNVMLVCYLTGTPNSLMAQRVSMNPPVAPGVPASFAGVVQSTSSIAWSWGNVADESGFDLHDTSEISRGITWPDVLSITETNLPENTQVTRHVHAFSDYIYGASSNSATARTKIHDPTASDFYPSVVSSTQINIVVTEPTNPTEATCKVERQNGSKWIIVQDWAANYNNVPDPGRTPNTSYTYRITYKNGAGVVTAVSPTQSVTTSAPAVPGSFAGTVQSGSSILWSWSDVANENNYLLHGPGETPETSVARNAISIVEGGLAENTSVTRHLHAVNGVAQSAATASVTKTTFIHDPTVSDFSLVLTTPTSITVNVTPPPNPAAPTGCQIQRSVDNQNWTILKDFNVAGYSATDLSLTSGATYYYRFRYQNAQSVVTAFSPTQSKVATLAPVITTGNKKTRNPNTTIQGTGTVGSLVTVYFNGSPEASQATVNSSGNWSYAVATKSEAVYTVTATATLGGPPSSPSNSIQVTIDTTGPAPPANIRIACYSNTIDVLWDSSPSSDVAGYQVSRKLGPGGTWSVLNASQLILGNQYRDSTALNGQQYFYRVAAVDDALSD